jgi:anti-sigma factor (TIGR02949 family)
MKMDCHSVRSRLAGYLDRQLTADEELGIARHLEGCPSCRQLLEQQRAIRVVLREAATAHPAPAGLADRIRARLVQEAPAPEPAATPAAPAARPTSPMPEPPIAQPWWQRPWLGLPVAACGGLLAGMALTVLLAPNLPWLRQEAANNALVDEVVDDHIRALMPGHLADVASTDQHTVKPWFAGRLDFSPPVYDLKAEGFPLIGGRLDYLHQRTVAALVYRRRLHTINVYVWPADASAQASNKSSSGLLQRHGYQLLGWQQQGMQLWAVSDLNGPELQQFAALLQAQGAKQ